MRNTSKIIIVEDEPIISINLVETITSLGLLYLGPANTIASARDIIERFSVDAAILDLALPDGDGRELIDLLDERNAPILVTTGTDIGTEHVPANVAILLKPYTLAEIEAAVIELAQRSAIVSRNASPTFSFSPA